MAGFDVADVYELEGEGPAGVVHKVRRAVGARAFGFNYFVFLPHHVGHQHDHVDDQHEEVYFVVKGSGTMLIGDEEVALRPGRFLRIDPAATRVPSSGSQGLEFVTIGAPIDRQYEPPSWG
jgi:mannose-6-phosphate isomerase-like protein (cupin superfamily)